MFYQKAWIDRLRTRYRMLLKMFGSFNVYLVWYDRTITGMVWKCANKKFTPC